MCIKIFFYYILELYPFSRFCLNKILVLKLGYSHPIFINIPKHLKVICIKCIKVTRTFVHSATCTLEVVCGIQSIIASQ